MREAHGAEENLHAMRVVLALFVLHDLEMVVHRKLAKQNRCARCLKMRIALSTYGRRLKKDFAEGKKKVRWRSTDKETRLFKVGDHLATSGFSDALRPELAHHHQGQSPN